MGYSYSRNDEARVKWFKRINEMYNEMYPYSSARIHGSEAWSSESLLATENDAYCVNNWDIFSLDQCFEFGLNWEE
jgi:hypothetical protein